VKLYFAPEKVFLVVWVIREVQSSSGRVPLVAGEDVLLPVPRICNEGALEGFLVEVGYDGLGDLYPKPFDCGVRVVDPSRLADPAELEQIQ
jgi:hypothetical protein